MEKAEVDKVFRDKEKECGHMKDKKVKPLQFDLIINYMRTNRSSMSIHSLNRIISEFCGDPSDDFCIQRSEAWTFIMEHLEECPPLNLESRKFWMELVSFGKSPIIRCENLVKAFHNSCLLKFGRYEDVSYDYQLFLLELLEWDFAAVLSNFESSATEIVENPKTSSRTARTKIDLSSMDNLELIPLAFTLICALKKGDLVENALDQEHLYERLSGLFEKATDLCSKKLYARLIGLLFDVHLFVNKRDMYFTAFSHADLPTSYREQMRKVRTQLADSMF
uniref:Uncharacterized protein n=1 Tax=Ditylenchus dipsaci TaxID=166011 RepID=A0A915D1I3_9BILA